MISNKTMFNDRCNFDFLSKLSNNEATDFQSQNHSMRTDFSDFNMNVSKSKMSNDNTYEDNKVIKEDNITNENLSEKVFKCQFSGCKKVYTNNSRLEIHFRTHVK